MTDDGFRLVGEILALLAELEESRHHSDEWDDPIHPDDRPNTRPRSESLFDIDRAVSVRPIREDSGSGVPSDDRFSNPPGPLPPDTLIRVVSADDGPVVLADIPGLASTDVTASIDAGQVLTIRAKSSVVLRVPLSEEELELSGSIDSLLVERVDYNNGIVEVQLSHA